MGEVNGKSVQIMAISAHKLASRKVLIWSTSYSAVNRL